MSGLTLVRSADDRYLTKRILGDGGTADFDNPHLCFFRPLEFFSFEDFARLLEKASRLPKFCIIRAGVRPGISLTTAHRRAYLPKPDLPVPTLVSAPRDWVAIDADSVPPPPGLDLLDGAKCSGFIRSLLPVEFQEAACWWQLTAGHLRKPGIRCRLWFLLDREVEDATLRGWAMAVNSAAGFTLVDHALFNPTQPHYTAQPLFENPEDDPVPVRTGALPGLERVKLKLAQATAQARLSNRGVRAGSGASIPAQATGGLTARALAIGPESFHRAILLTLAWTASARIPRAEVEAAVSERLGWWLAKADTELPRPRAEIEAHRAELGRIADWAYVDCAVGNVAWTLRRAASFRPQLQAALQGAAFRDALALIRESSRPRRAALARLLLDSGGAGWPPPYRGTLEAIAGEAP
jgi:hypothetical protein